MNKLRAAWPSICDFSKSLDVPPGRWKHAWSTHELSAKRLYNAIRWRRPGVIVETGTFEALGTYVMAKAAQENGNNARIYTVDYDGDPEAVSISREDWEELRRIRAENLQMIRERFPGVEVTFLNGDSRQVLPGLFPEKLDRWDFFFQDSMHFTAGILSEWEIMKPFAQPGALVVFDDVCLDWRKLPSHLLRRNDFCLHFVFREVLRGGWSYRSTGEGRGQFWAQKTG